MDSNTIIALVSLTLGLTIHGAASIWWASRITSILENTQRALMELMVDMKAVNKTYVTKEDCSKELARIDKSLEAMWNKVDHLNDKVK